VNGKTARKGVGQYPRRIVRFPEERSLAQLAVEAAEKPLEETRVPKHLRKLPTAAPKRRIEIVSSGVDEFAQVFGTDPYGGTSWPGLRVPRTATALLSNVTPQTPATKLRYLFMLAAFTIPEGARARIVSLRTSWTLGAIQGEPAAPRFVEQLVTNPFFRLQDGNVSFHLRQSAPTANQWSGNAQGVIGNLTPPPATLPDMPNLIFRNSRMPAMLFENITFAGPTSFYSAAGLTAYTPPNGGLPWGDTITTGYGTFQDLRMQYADNDWNDCDIPVEGPACVQLFASVRQTNAGQGGRTALTTPNPFVFTMGLSPEEQFLQNFPSAIIWRVAGSLGVEMEDRK
jgi:hypothetical protein